uniref:Uncharacterized protein n=1 Tax=Stegastes partitus TaxID=144197 RepID=A0A3B5B4R8_9TELE
VFPKCLLCSRCEIIEQSEWEWCFVILAHKLSFALCCSCGRMLVLKCGKSLPLNRVTQLGSIACVHLSINAMPCSSDLCCIESDTEMLQGPT